MDHGEMRERAAKHGWWCGGGVLGKSAAGSEAGSEPQNTLSNSKHNRQLNEFRVRIHHQFGIACLLPQAYQPTRCTAEVVALTSAESSASADS